MNGLSKEHEIKCWKIALFIWFIGLIFCFAVFGGMVYLSGSMTFLEALLLSLVVPLIPVAMIITGQP